VTSQFLHPAGFLDEKMDLTSDLPFWTVHNGLLRTYPPLDADIHCEALVIGGGISGALLAHRLSKKGVDCVLIDRRDIGFGSTSASTALLQYEIDTPLHKLRQQVGAAAAERAYSLGIEAIHRLQKLAGTECGFAFRPSLQIAAKVNHLADLQSEYRTRRQLKFPVRFLNRQELKDCGINGAGALRSSIAGEVDPYRLTHRLLRLACATGLRVFDQTAALRYRHSRSGVTVDTSRGSKVKCHTVFFATGYETRDILPRNVVSLRSTYAFVSEPFESLDWWKDRSLIWGTGDPYIYLRTTADRRVLVGGEDDHVLNPARRDRQIPAKTATLVRRFRKLFPQIQLEPAFGWAGLFGSTKDGLAYIGAHPSFPRAYFALGFGGNGITFSEIASRILTDLFLGRVQPDQKIFRFDR
jgi:glycine/D-amino acid oxidase-like deaminating enzyme